MKRKRNDLFSTIQSHLARRRVERPKTLSRDWWRDASVGDREKALKRSYGFKAKEARFLAASSYSDVFGDRAQNPRVYPGNLPPLAEQSLNRLIKGKAMAQKKRKSKKKKSSRKGKMPAGLRKYWAKKRRASKAKRNPRRRVRARVRTRTIIKYRTRKVYVKAKRARRRASNPRPKIRRIVAPRGLTAKGLQQFRRTVAKLTGKRTRIVPN